MIEKILSEIKNQNINITSWILGFTGILFVRLLLEGLSSPSLSGIIHTDVYTIIHIGLYFLSVTLGTILILGYFTNDYKNSPKLVLYGLPLIWLAPILDILFSGGKGFRMAYIFDTGKNIVINFLTFFGPKLTTGATIGIRIGIAISLIGLGYLIWNSRKKVSSVVWGILSIYLFVFIFASLPGLIYTTTHLSNPTTNISKNIDYIERTILKSTISHNTLREGVYSVTRLRFLELSFDKFMTQILFILSSLMCGYLLLKLNSKKFWAVVKNARPERVNFYTASLFCGIGFAYINKLGNPFVWIDTLGIISLIIAWISLWMHAVHLNDINDIKIDEISNQNRPLIKKELDKEEMGDVGKLWLVVGLLGAWSAGFYPFFMALVYIACSYIYSAPPLRLRRFPIISSFLIGIACLATVLAGFFMISRGKEIQNFPPLLSIGIVIMVTLAINFKDIKDVEGDKATGIMTIPTLFPKTGVKIIAILFSFSILLVPFFLSFYLLYILSIPCAIFGYKIITKKPYSEKHIFTLRFFFLGGIAISYIIIYWYANVYNLI